MTADKTLTHLRCLIVILFAMVFDPGMLHAFDAAAHHAQHKQLISNDILQGMIQDLSYDLVENKALRFRYHRIEHEKIGHFWLLEEQNLRNKEIVIRYSGVLPKEISFVIARSKSGAKHIVHSPQTDTADIQTLKLKIPDTKPFEKVTWFSIEIHQDRVKRMYGDFTIHEIKIQNPFAGQEALNEDE